MQDGIRLQTVSKDNTSNRVRVSSLRAIFSVFICLSTRGEETCWRGEREVPPMTLTESIRAHCLQLLSLVLML